MSNCSNCYGGCTDIISDKCVRYTGIAVPVLGIETGDSLSYVEQALIDFLTSTLTGIGIVPVIDPDIICTLVHDYLPECGDISIVDLISALIKAVCNLQEQITDVAEEVAIINNTYDVDCLDVVTGNEGTHDIVQAVIDKLCSLDDTLTALIAALPSTYVALDDLDDLIDAHLADTSTLMCNKMVPYVAVEYYGPLTSFDITGAGTGDWVNIYLCNGNNGTPDKRGRVPVGTTTGMGGPAFNTAVDPTIIGNPTYVLNSIGGANTVVLSASQIPIHTHVATSVVTEVEHYHYLFNSDITTSGNVVTTNTYPVYWENRGGTNYSYTIVGTATTPALGRSSSTKTNLSVNTTNAVSGGSLSHSNIQPVLACHYIIYLP